MKIKNQFYFILFIFFLLFFIMLSTMYWINLHLIDINQAILNLFHIQNEYNQSFSTMKLSLEEASFNRASPFNRSKIEKENSFSKNFIENSNKIQKDLSTLDKSLGEEELQKIFFLKKSLDWLLSFKEKEAKKFSANPNLFNEYQVIENKIFLLLDSNNFEFLSWNQKLIEKEFHPIISHDTKYLDYQNIFIAFVELKKKQYIQKKKLQNSLESFYKENYNILDPLTKSTNIYKNKASFLFISLLSFLIFILISILKIFNILIFKNIENISAIIKEFALGKGKFKSIVHWKYVKNNEFYPLLFYFRRFINFLKNIIFKIQNLIHKNKQTSVDLKNQMLVITKIFSKMYGNLSNFKINSLSLYHEIKNVYHSTEGIQFFITKEFDLLLIQISKIEKAHSFVQNISLEAHEIATRSQGKLEMILSLKKDLKEISKGIKMNQILLADIVHQLKLSQSILKWIHQIADQSELLSINITLQETSTNTTSDELLSLFSGEIRKFSKMIQENIYSISKVIEKLMHSLLPFQNAMQHLKELQIQLFNEFENLYLSSKAIHGKSQNMLLLSNNMHSILNSLMGNSKLLENNSILIQKKTKNITQTMDNLSSISDKHQKIFKELFISLKNIERNYTKSNHKIIQNLKEVEKLNSIAKKFKMH